MSLGTYVPKELEEIFRSRTQPHLVSTNQDIHIVVFWNSLHVTMRGILHRQVCVVPCTKFRINGEAVQACSSYLGPERFSLTDFLDETLIVV